MVIGADLQLRPIVLGKNSSRVSDVDKDQIVIFIRFDLPMASKAKAQDPLVSQKNSVLAFLKKSVSNLMQLCFMLPLMSFSL